MKSSAHLEMNPFITLQWGFSKVLCIQNGQIRIGKNDRSATGFVIQNNRGKRCNTIVMVGTMVNVDATSLQFLNKIPRYTRCTQRSHKLAIIAQLP